MKRKATREVASEEGDLGQSVRRRISQVINQYLFIAGVLFIGAGRLDWWWAWIYLGAGLVILVVNLRLLPPEVIAERGRPQENVKRWDRWLTTITLFPTLAMLVISGLDERFGWSPALALGIHLLGVVLYCGGQGLFSWAMASNVHFSTLVRIAIDRNHQVATGGPYRYVRHPGYSGFILFSLATPLALGSLWALIPAAMTGLLLILRTALEDRTLKAELAGYRDYAQRVRYRLLPGVW